TSPSCQGSRVQLSWTEVWSLGHNAIKVPGMALLPPNVAAATAGPLAVTVTVGPSTPAVLGVPVVPTDPDNPLTLLSADFNQELVRLVTPTAPQIQALTWVGTQDPAFDEICIHLILSRISYL